MENKEQLPGIKAKHVAVALALTFTVVLAVIIGKKMSTEAMAVVIGIVCGVAASIPTTALLTLVLTRRDRQKEDERQVARPASYPPVVVIQGGAPHSLQAAPQAGYWPALSQGPSVQRQFHVVGSEDVLLEQ
ncbi:MAG TPA: hypothetical protein PKO09_12060 [Anaerolineae bacterium]|nr:hypothetical protein [Anaerolineae bacterium]